MRILITGAGGWMARHFIDRMTSTAELHLHARTDGDLSGGTALDAVGGVDVVVHLAGRSFGSPRELYSDNTVATAAVLEWMSRRQVPRIVFASTGALYSNNGAQPSRETDAVEPISHYAASKAAAEDVVRRFVLDSNGALAAIILRFPHVYGPGNRKGVVWNFLDAAAATGTVLLDGEGAQERDLLYIDDAVSALRAAVAFNAPGVTTLNAGSGIKTRLAELPPLLSRVLQRPVLAQPSGRPELPPRFIWLDSGPAKRLLNWSASTTLPDGLKRTAAWRLSLS